MKLIGREDFASDELVENLPLRWEKRAEINKAIEDWTTQRDKMEVFHTLAKAVIPCAPIMDTLEALSDPHLTHRGMVFDAEHPTRGKHKNLPGTWPDVSGYAIPYFSISALRFSPRILRLSDSGILA